MADLTLELDDEVEPEIDDTPSNIMVNVANGETDEVVTFNVYDAGTSWPAIGTVSLDQWGGATACVGLPALTMGDYTLEAVGTTSTTATLAIQVKENPLDVTLDIERTALTIPSWELGTATWRFIDSSITDNRGSYVMPRNPSKWTNPNRPNNLEHDVTTAPDGNILAWQGAEKAWTFEFSGYLETQEEYEALLFWSELRRRFWLIDHKDNARYVTFEHFDARARIVPGRPWAHDYTMKVVHFYRQGL